MDALGSEWIVSDPRILDRLTMRPAGERRMSGRRVWVRATTEKKFTSNVSFSISGETVLVVLNPCGSPNVTFTFSTPALLLWSGFQSRSTGWDKIESI